MTMRLNGISNMTKQPHQYHIHCINHDTKEVFVVETFTGATKVAAKNKAEKYCKLYNTTWCKIISISYCINEKDEVEYESLSKQQRKRIG